MKFTAEDGTITEGEVCNECRQIIPGKLMMSEGGNLIVVDGSVAQNNVKLTGICIGMAWIEYYNCLDCYKKRTKKVDDE